MPMEPAVATAAPAVTTDEGDDVLVAVELEEADVVTTAVVAVVALELLTAAVVVASLELDSAADVSTAEVEASVVVAATEVAVEVAASVVLEPPPAETSEQKVSTAGRTSSGQGSQPPVSVWYVGYQSRLLLTDGNVGSAVAEDAGGSIGREGVDAVADAHVVGLRAAGDLGPGRVDAGDGTAGNVREGLGRDAGGEGDGSDGVLHCGGGRRFLCGFLSFSLF